MFNKIRKTILAFAALSSFPAGSYAGSVNQPGFTTGIPVYGAFPEGLYLTVIPEYGDRSTTPTTALFAFTPFFFYQSPWKIGPFDIAAVFSPIYLDIKPSGAKGVSGFYNTYGGVQFTHQFGNGWGAGFRLGGFVSQDTQVANNFNTFDTRFGVTYFKDGTNFSVNFNYGTPIDDKRTAPDYLNLDTTLTQTFDNVIELGVVAFASTDLSTPFPGYRRQGQVAAGFVVGHQFDKVNVQIKLTSDLYERNYGGRDRRIWANITVPLYTPTAGSVAPR